MNNSVELLEKAVAHAKAIGIAVRTELMDGTPGGLCRIGSRFHLFLDPSQTAADQLDVVMQALHDSNLAKGPADSQH